MKRTFPSLVFEEDDLNEEAVNQCIAENKEIKEERAALVEIKLEQETKENLIKESSQEDLKPPVKRRKMNEGIQISRSFPDENTPDGFVTESLQPGEGTASIAVARKPLKKQYHRNCDEDGCSKQARGKTGKCKAHGGGRRCGVKDCPKSARGKTGKCYAHGGGRRCEVEGCQKSAQGINGKCKAHGGGKRCNELDCSKSAFDITGKCVAHGGGKRCEVESCPISARGNTGKCAAHGGGKRCNEPGCQKHAKTKIGKCVSHSKRSG